MRIFRVLFLFLTACIAATSLYAQQPLPLSARELLQSAGAVDSKNLYGVNIMLYETVVKIDSANRKTFRHHMIYRIDSPEAVESWSSVGINWSPWHQKRPTIQARVVTPDGIEHMLDQKTLTDAPANDNRPQVFDDERDYSGPLPAVKVGSVVEEDIMLEDAEPLFAAGIAQRFLIGRSSPVAKQRIVIEAPASLPIKYEARGIPAASLKREEANGITRISFEQMALPAVEDIESNLPSDAVPWPYIAVSTAKSWQAIATQYNQLIEKQIASTDLKSVAARHIGKDRLETIHNLTAYLHGEIRYTGVEFGESKLVPRKPEDTFKEKYGDCKDKAAALIALLRAAGIDARMALLSSGPGIDVDQDFPGMGVFDHAIVYVPGTPDTWIDATYEFAITGIPYMDQGRMALVISPDTTELRKTPEAKPQDNILVEERQFELSQYGPARITEISRPHGSIEAIYREEYGSGDSKEIREQLGNYMRKEYLADSLTIFEPGKGSDLRTPFAMKLESAKAKRGFTDLESASTAIRFDGFFGRFPMYIRAENKEAENNVNDAEPSKKKTRSADVAFESFITEWRYTIASPPGFHVRSLPSNRSLNIGPALMTQQFQSDKNGVVTASLRLDSVRGRYTAAEALAARKAIQDVQNADPLMIQFEPAGSSELAAGNVRKALEIYREFAAKFPAEALRKVRLSRALLSVGLGEQAREEAREAVKLEPKSAIAYRNLSWILQHDLIGRQFKKGFDWQGAVAAQQKAKELDPKDADIVGELAIILEHDEAGERYSSKARLKDAIASYREITAIDKEEARFYDDHILFDLLYSSQFKEAESMLADLPQTQQRLAFAIAISAALQGPEAAVKRSLEISKKRGDRIPALRAASEILRNLRMYSACAELVAAAAEGDANAAQVLGQVQGYRNTKQYNDVIKDDNPRSPIQKFFLYLLDSSLISFDPIKEFEYILPSGPKRVEIIKKQAGVLRAAFKRLDVSTTVGADMLISALQLSLQGDEKRGYRIRMQGAAASSNQTAFVTRADGNYHILGLAPDVAGVGVEALRLIKAGNLEAAKQWLDWVREDLNRPGGDDPYAWPVFPNVWRRGDPMDAAKMRIAALALIANTEFVKPHFSELKAAAAELSATDKMSAQTMLLSAYWALEQWPQVKELSWQMLQSQPTSIYALWGAVESARKMNDEAAWEKAIAMRVAKLPEDSYALVLRAALFEHKGKFVEARSIMKQLIDSGEASPDRMNEYGWDALFTDKVEAEDIDLVQRASGMTQNLSYDIVHTLACLYAEIGKTKEAYDLLLHAISLNGLDEPDSPVWYGLGRLAEQYGEKAAALACYKRIEKADKDILQSTWALGQKRIRLLETK